MIANWIGWPLLVVYAAAMLGFPWVDGNWSWKYVQDVWDRWQTLNAAALAFVASLVAFNISRYNEERQRERDFVAARSYLPSTLSTLMDYFSQSAAAYKNQWDAGGTGGSPLPRPVLPTDYREVFGNCIRHADPRVGSYLSKIIVKLQVHEARLRDLLDQVGSSHIHVVDKPTLISYMCQLGELHALVGNLFGFARGQEDLPATPLTWDDFKNSFGILGIERDDVYVDKTWNLESFTKRAVERLKKED